MTSHEPLDGVIKFGAEHQRRSLGSRQFAEMVASLQAWRHIFFRLNFIGQDPGRYDGAGFGNVSARIPPHTATKGKRKFIVTGTQTGARPHLGLGDYCVVESYDMRLNRVQSYGDTMPSSESMTHGAIYSAVESIRSVIHFHNRKIFDSMLFDSDVPKTDKNIAYGTPQMAIAMDKIVRSTGFNYGFFATAGHDEGVFAYGPSIDDTLGQALALQRKYS